MFDGSKIKDYREKIKMSQEELSKVSHVSRVTISQLETTAKSSTSIDVLLAIAKALHKDVEDFFVPEKLSKLN